MDDKVEKSIEWAKILLNDYVWKRQNACVGAEESRWAEHTEHLETLISAAERAERLAGAVKEVINDCNRYTAAPPWEIKFNLDKAIREWERV